MMKDWLAKLDEIDTLVRRDSRKAYDFYQEGTEPSLKYRGRGLGRAQAAYDRAGGGHHDVRRSSRETKRRRRQGRRRGS